jgi:hypothetical protein
MYSRAPARIIGGSPQASGFEEIAGRLADPKCAKLRGDGARMLKGADRLGAMRELLRD